MRVGIDVRPLTPGSSGGIVQFTEGLCLSLFQTAPASSYVVYCSESRYRLPGTLPANAEHVMSPDDLDPIWLDARLAHDRVDVLFRPFPLDDDLAFPLQRRFVLVPDLQHEDYPDFFSVEERTRRQRAFREAIDRGGAIGVLSEHSLSRVRSLYPDAQVTTAIVSPGRPSLAQTLEVPLSDAEQRAIPDGVFFLYPANLWPHKNHRRLLRAFERFSRCRPEPVSLVLTGYSEGWPELRAEFPSLQMHHLGFVRPRLLAELYRRCVALVYFSLYEGFGIPLLEAFQMGAPVLCSDRTSLVEVGGDAVVRCDPLDVDAMAGLMQHVADSPDLRVELQTRGKARLERYDWAHAAAEVHRALCTLARAPARHDDILDVIQTLSDRLAAIQSDREARGQVIEGLTVAVRERTDWAERVIETAEERAELLQAQDRTIQQLKQALETRTNRCHALDVERQTAAQETVALRREIEELRRQLADARRDLAIARPTLGGRLRTSVGWMRDRIAPRMQNGTE